MSDKIKQALQWLVDSVEREFPEACSGALVCPLDAAYAALASLDAQPAQSDDRKLKRLAKGWMQCPDCNRQHVQVSENHPFVQAHRAAVDAQPEAEQPEKVLMQLTNGVCIVAAPVQPASKPEVVEDLRMLVGKLVRALLKAAPDHALPAQAMDYLQRKGLQGSPLRDDSNSDAPKQAEPIAPEITSWPAKIWLQHGFEYLPHFEVVLGTRDDVTWCQDNIDTHDVAYVRADLAHPAAQPCQSISDEPLAMLKELDALLEEAWNARTLPASVISGEMVRKYRAVIRNAESRAVRGEVKPAKTGEAG